MREIYHLAADVRVWLGPRTEETTTCAKFIAEFAGEIFSSKPPDRKPSAIVETVAKAVLLSSGKIIRTMYGFGHAVGQMADLAVPFHYSSGLNRMFQRTISSDRARIGLNQATGRIPVQRDTPSYDAITKRIR